MKRFYSNIIAVLLCGFMMNSFNALAQNKQLSPQEKQYLDFLYEYMPLGDRIDYDTDFYIMQVKYALKARETFSWGKKIPEDVFKHFVLVYRVNNENLDTARVVMFNALHDRVKNLSMYQAALEVNHWCHEYVNYKASDGRTSSPLATMRTSWGRCGEESTFAVTALRSVGIPARQCYTPRWAHTDDNHAWVEVWIEGRWYHLGACEPEAELNVAWFDAPSKRAMMVHTTVFGKYDGREEKNFVSEKYSKINLLSNYAPVKKLTVTVKDKKGNKVKDAQVSFGLYNYAEYFPLAKVTTDAEGKASLTTGYGDIIIWAKKGKNFVQKQAFATDTDVTVVLSDENDLLNQTLTITPPKEQTTEVLSEEAVQKNNLRLVYEDSLRNAYIATFPTDEDIDKFVESIKLQTVNRNASMQPIPNGREEMKKFIKNSWGNYKEIEKVIQYTPQEGINYNLSLLSLIYEKDLRDAKAKVLTDHLDYYQKANTKAYYQNATPQTKLPSVEYTLNPRIALEKITPWRSFIWNYFHKPFKDGSEVAKWIAKNISLNTKDNYYGVPISPEGVLKAKQCDKKSREILFVAMCRTFMTDARYEWATGRAQWRKDADSEWQYAFKEKKSKDKNNCLLVVNNATTNSIKPEYYSQFTIQRLKDNEFVTLDYEYDPHFASLPDSLYLPSGIYRLVVGNRNSKGKVQVSETYFTLTEGKRCDITVAIPEVTEDVASYGEFKTQHLTDNLLNIVAVIDPYKEPSRHLLVDISKYKDEFNKHKDVQLILVLDESLLNKDFSPETFPPLPDNTKIIYSKDKSEEKAIVKATGLDFLNNYPILTLINDGDIIYLSQGYKISSQEELLKVINKLK
ncbi:MAG: transglutaminase domain-containing protein [Bacteroidales bacterium]|nr:transglutaminase domain-containing protein [Bacteroidales bacterium]